LTRKIKKSITGRGFRDSASQGFGWCHFALDPIGGGFGGQGKAAEVKASSAIDGIVGVSVVICIEKFLEPLNELKIILEAAFNQAVDRHNLKQTRA